MPLLACGAGSPAPTPRGQAGSRVAPTASFAACAPALPLLAGQHAPNRTRLYLAALSVEDDVVTVGPPVLATRRPGYVNQPAFSRDGAGLYFTWRPEGGRPTSGTATFPPAPSGR